MWRLLLACAQPDDGKEPERYEPAPGVEEVTLTTEDDVTLVADWYGGCEDGGVLLLHMVPPTYDRTTWATTFIEGLREDGWCVLAIDRRGAGESGGVAEEAYDGPDGKLDAYAAVDFMTGEGVARLAIVGASNGTATALDYAVDPGGRPSPEVMSWMSPGSYTNANSAMDDLDLARLSFHYPPEEASWPERQESRNPGEWAWFEYEGGDHGTFLFETNPEVEGDVRGYLLGG
ncbi:MAG: hypothetical protein ACOZNI_16365 [Myxococcota bacterium]